MGVVIPFTTLFNPQLSITFVFMSTSEDFEVQTHYMHRCLQLAKLGTGAVAPNPLVGAVLVHDGQIIGEGYHTQYGGPHAEVNCIHSVKQKDQDKISRSVLYVSLEPCSHFGKTPPCTDLIISRKIPTVVIGCRDPNPKVNGKGIRRLRHAGIKVMEGILEKPCRDVNKRFFIFQTRQRPYIILKWAETADGKLNDGTSQRLTISGEITQRLVHKWRNEESAILVGTHTALWDDPELTTRFWTGPSPLRAVIDRNLKLPRTLKLFNGKQPTVIFNTIKQEQEGSLIFYRINPEGNTVQQILRAFYQMNVQSVIVEGGAALLESFLQENAWDEARIITNEKLVIKNGLAAPVLNGYAVADEWKITTDRIRFYYKNNLPL